MAGTESRDSPTARALEVLQSVAARAQPVAMSELAAALDIPPPTVHRIAMHLEELGYLRRALNSKRFVVGPRLAKLGLNAIAAHAQDAPRHAILQRVADVVGEHCAISVVQQNEVLVIDSVQASRLGHPGGLRFIPGGRTPLHCTSTGKLFLAYLSDPEQRRLLRALHLQRYTDKTIVDKKELVGKLKIIRKLGWASTSEEYLLGVAGCGVPIFGRQGDFLASVSITVPIAHMTLAEMQGHIPVLQHAARDLTPLFNNFENDDEAS